MRVERHIAVALALAACSRQGPLTDAARAAQERGEWAAAERDFTAAGDAYGAALAHAMAPVEGGAGLRGALDVAFDHQGRALARFPEGVRDARTGAAVPAAELHAAFGSPPALPVGALGAPLPVSTAAGAPAGATPPQRLAEGLVALRTADGALELRDPARAKLVLRREGVGEPFAVSADARSVAWQDAAGLHLAALDERHDTLLDTARDAGGAARLAWSRDGRLVAACGDDLRIYDATERRIAHRLAASGPCALSDDGQTALAGGRLFALPVLPPHLHRGAGLIGAAFVRGELVTFGAEGKVAAFEVPSGDEHANAWVREKSPCGSSGLAAAAGRVAAGGAVWTPGGAGFEKLAQVPGEVAATALAADLLLVSRWPATVAAFDARTGAPRWSVAGFACTLASNGVLLAAGGRDGTVWLLEARTGARARSLEALHGPVRALAFSADAGWLAASADETTIVVYSVADTDKYILNTKSPARVLAFSRDGALLAAGGEDGVVSLWDLRARSLRATLPALGGPIGAVAFSPEGEWLVSGTAAFGGARLTHLPPR